jgi:hypothetical protein
MVKSLRSVPERARSGVSPQLPEYEKPNSMGCRMLLDMLGAAVRGGTPESREVYMKRNAERYAVTLANLVR